MTDDQQKRGHKWYSVGDEFFTAFGLTPQAAIENYNRDLRGRAVRIRKRLLRGEIVSPREQRELQWRMYDTDAWYEIWTRSS